MGVDSHRAETTGVRTLRAARGAARVDSSGGGARQAGRRAGERRSSASPVPAPVEGRRRCPGMAFMEKPPAGKVLLDDTVPLTAAVEASQSLQSHTVRGRAGQGGRGGGREAGPGREARGGGREAGRRPDGAARRGSRSRPAGVCP